MGGRFFIENSRRGVSPGRVVPGGARGREVCGKIWGGEGGVNIYFGAEIPTKDLVIGLQIQIWPKHLENRLQVTDIAFVIGR